MKKKAIVTVVALVLVLCCAMGGTLAWLKTETTPVVNTFTYGDINIDLSESENLNLKMIPGNDIKKDPTVTVKANSEDCWLFVRVKASDNFDTFMTYAVEEGWTLYDTDKTGSNIETAGNDDYVIYRKVTASDIDQNFTVLANNNVTVRGEGVTKEMFAALTEATRPTLTFTAYAVQQDNLTLEQAYNQAFNAN